MKRSHQLKANAMTFSATFTNEVTGEARTVSAAATKGQTALGWAWGCGLRTVCSYTGWNRHDVAVSNASTK